MSVIYGIPFKMCIRDRVADDIGIIYNGSLLYQDAIDTGENLERLFMDIVRKEREA